MTKAVGYTLLARPGWCLNVSHATAVAALSINGTVVSRDQQAPRTVVGAACDPPGWKGLAPGIAATVASQGTCLRAVRSISPTPLPEGVLCCTSYQDPVSGKPTGPCTLRCPDNGEVIQSVRFVDYGTASGSCGRFKVDRVCTASNHTAAISALVRQQCVGNASCAVTRNAAWGDPCPGVQTKRLTVAVICGRPTVDGGGDNMLAGGAATTGMENETGVENEQVYGFGQSVSPGLSVVGTTKFIATFSRTTDAGPSHAPAPFYISLATGTHLGVHVGYICLPPPHSSRPSYQRHVSRNGVRSPPSR